MSQISQEHKGLAKIHTICAEMNAIWRPTTSNDLGIDGQIEFLEHGSVVSTGKLVAVQVKSGASYFRSEDEHYVKYYPKAQHRNYWKRLILPVILVLHNPDRDYTIYSRVKHQLLIERPILINKSELFDRDCRDHLLQFYEQDMVTTDLQEVLYKFRQIILPIGDVSITGIEFLLGCVDMNQEYLELRMCRIQAILESAAGDDGLFLSTHTYEYIFRCISRCWHYQLVESFEPEFDHYWYNLKVVPDISVPLTGYGKIVIQYLWENISRYINENIPNPEDYAKKMTYFAQEASTSFEFNEDFGILPK